MSGEETYLRRRIEGEGRREKAAPSEQRELHEWTFTRARSKEFATPRRGLPYNHTMSRPRRTKRDSVMARRIVSQAILLVLSFLYLFVAAMLALFGYIVGWVNDPGRPIIGVLMVILGMAVFVLGPHAIKLLTDRDPIDPPPYM